MINNKMTTVKVSGLINNLRNQKLIQKDMYLSAPEIVEAAISKKLILRENATNQFFSKINLPKNLVNKVSKGLLREIVAELADYQYKDTKKKMFVRTETIDNKSYIRATLSDKYCVIDNFEVVDAIMANFDPEAEINLRGFINDDNSMKLEIIDKTKETILSSADRLFNMITVENSETGNSSLNFKFGLYRLLCSNGMMRPVTMFNNERVIHLGNRNQHLLATVRNQNILAIANGNDEIINMYKDSKSIYVQKPYDMIEEILVEKPKKFQEATKDIKNRKYSENTLFNVYNAVTETIHNYYTDNHSRVDNEVELTGVIMNHYNKNYRNK
jgi:hypothetical protein